MLPPRAGVVEGAAPNRPPPGAGVVEGFVDPKSPPDAGVLLDPKPVLPV